MAECTCGLPPDQPMHHAPHCVMVSDAESHGPAETWTLYVCPECGWWEADHGDVPIWCPDDHRPEVELESVVVARPERVCQELAEAIVARLRANGEALNVSPWAVEWATDLVRDEFVERFGKESRG